MEWFELVGLPYIDAKLSLNQLKKNMQGTIIDQGKGTTIDKILAIQLSPLLDGVNGFTPLSSFQPSTNYQSVVVSLDSAFYQASYDDILSFFKTKTSIDKQPPMFDEIHDRDYYTLTIKKPDVEYCIFGQKSPHKPNQIEIQGIIDPKLYALVQSSLDEVILKYARTDTVKFMPEKLYSKELDKVSYVDKRYISVFRDLLFSIKKSYVQSVEETVPEALRLYCKEEQYFAGEMIHHGEFGTGYVMQTFENQVQTILACFPFAKGTSKISDIAYKRLIHNTDKAPLGSLTKKSSKKARLLKNMFRN